MLLDPVSSMSTVSSVGDELYMLYSTTLDVVSVAKVVRVFVLKVGVPLEYAIPMLMTGASWLPDAIVCEDGLLLVTCPTPPPVDTLDIAPSGLKITIDFLSA